MDENGKKHIILPLHEIEQLRSLLPRPLPVSDHSTLDGVIRTIATHAERVRIRAEISSGALLSETVSTINAHYNFGPSGLKRCGGATHVTMTPQQFQTTCNAWKRTLHSVEAAAPAPTPFTYAPAAKKAPAPSLTLKTAIPQAHEVLQFPEHRASPPVPQAETPDTVTTDTHASSTVISVPRFRGRQSE